MFRGGRHDKNKNQPSPQAESYTISDATLVVVRKDADGEDHAQRMRRIRGQGDPFLGLPQVAPYDRLVMSELQHKDGDSSLHHRGAEVCVSLW